jgi:hypothetical protein
MIRRRGRQAQISTSSIPVAFKAHLKSQIGNSLRKWTRKDVPSSKDWTNVDEIAARFVPPDEAKLLRDVRYLVSSNYYARQGDIDFAAVYDDTPMHCNLDFPGNQYIYRGDRPRTRDEKVPVGDDRLYWLPLSDNVIPHTLHEIYMAGIEAAIVWHLVGRALELCGTPGQLAEHWPNLLQLMQGDGTWGAHASTWLDRKTREAPQWPEAMIASRNMANSVLLRSSLLGPEDEAITGWDWKVDVMPPYDDNGFFVDWANNRIEPKYAFDANQRWTPLK